MWTDIFNVSLDKFLLSTCSHFLFSHTFVSTKRFCLSGLSLMKETTKLLNFTSEILNFTLITTAAIGF